MNSFLITIAIVLMVGMGLFMCFYGYLVIKFYTKIWKDKTLLDKYMKQRYGLFAHTRDKEKKEEQKDD